VDVCGEKKDAGWLWWAIDRAAKRGLGWTLGDRGTQTAERLEAQLPHAPHLIFATDCWHPDAKIFQQANPVQGQAHTFTIESLNHRIRCYLARLKRRTHSYSKSKQNLAASILFFIIQKCGGELVPAP
jgi:insertion element IS1 protein InsB